MARRGLPSFLDLNRLVVGLVSMALIVIACVLAFAVGAFGLIRSQYTMSGVFADASGIGKGSDVRMAGVSIGTVSGVHPDYALGEVIVTWKINDGVKLGSQTRADLALENLLGGEYIRLSGSVEPPYMSDLPTPQRRIPLSRTHTTYTVNGVLGNTAQTIELINPQTVNNVLAALATVLTGSSSDLGPLLTDLESVASAVNQRDADLRQLVANSQQVTATLAAKNQQLASLVDSADGLLKQLITRRDDLVNVLGAGSSAVGQLTALISSEQAHLQQILGDVTVAVHALGQELPQVDQGFAWSGPTFTDLATIGANGPWFDVVATAINPDVVGVLTQTLGGGK